MPKLEFDDSFRALEVVKLKPDTLCQSSNFSQGFAVEPRVLPLSADRQTPGYCGSPGVLEPFWPFEHLDRLGNLATAFRLIFTPFHLFHFHNLPVSLY